jgi:hypothetical protein
VCEQALLWWCCSALEDLEIWHLACLLHGEISEGAKDPDCRPTLLEEAAGNIPGVVDGRCSIACRAS